MEPRRRSWSLLGSVELALGEVLHTRQRGLRAFLFHLLNRIQREPILINLSFITQPCFAFFLTSNFLVPTSFKYWIVFRLIRIPHIFRYLHLGCLDLYILPRAVSEIAVTTSLQSEYDAAFFSNFIFYLGWYCIQIKILWCVPKYTAVSFLRNGSWPYLSFQGSAVIMKFHMSTFLIWCH